MKRYFLILAAMLCFGIVAHARNNDQDIVYLKNGNIIRGTIIAQVPNKSIKIETADGNIFVYQIGDIEKMTKEASAAVENIQEAHLQQVTNQQEERRSAERVIHPAGSELSIGLDGSILTLNGWKENGRALSNFGVGGSLKYAYNFNQTVAVTLQSGFLYFPGTSHNASHDGVKYMNSAYQIPIKLGARLSMQRFYVEPQVGISRFHRAFTEAYEAYSGEGAASTMPFTYAIGVGVMASRNFDFSVRYEGMSKNGTCGFLGLRIAYVIPFSKK